MICFAVAGMRTWLKCVAVGCCVLLGACSEREVVEEYLTADEPQIADRIRIEHLGRNFLTRDATVELLAEALRGPSDEARANLEYRFFHSYRRIQAPSIPESAYVASFLDNAIAVYRKRAAWALGAIGASGNSGATEKLTEALYRDSTGVLPVREDVRDALHRAFVTATSRPFDGLLSVSTVGVLDTIALSGGSTPIDGSESIRLEGGPFPDDVMIDAGGNSLGFVLAAPLGAYKATLRRPGDPVVYAIPVSAQRIDYRPAAGPEDAPELLGHASRHRIFTVLTGAVDTATGSIVSGRPIDHLRLSATDSTLARAYVKWRGPGWIDVSWTSCAPEPIASGVFRGVLLDSLSRPIGDAVLDIADLDMTPVPAGPLGRFRFDVGQTGAETFTLLITRPGFSTRSVTFVSIPDTEVSIWWDRPVRAWSAPAGQAADPYVLRTDSAVIRVPPGGCRLLRVQKLDQETPYLVARVSVAFDDEASP